MESGIPTPPTPTGAGENSMDSSTATIIARTTPSVKSTSSTTTNTTTTTAGPGVRRSASAGGKAVKPVHRVTKRSSTHPSSRPSVHNHSPVSPPSGADSRQKRVWKACERCRMKKTKCDGEFPCKRCRDDGLICAAGVRKRMEYKQLPRGYAEVLESTQYTLISTIHKLYAMVRKGQSWDLGEPSFNERGDPIVHDIANLLGCIRPNADADLPPHSVFPEDTAGLEKLAAELDQQQVGREKEGMGEGLQTAIESDRARLQRADSSDVDHSDFEHEHRRSFLSQNSVQNLSSPASLVSSYSEFEPSTICSDVDPSASLFALQSPTVSAPYQPSPTTISAPFQQVWPVQRNPSFTAIPPFVGQGLDPVMAELMSQGMVDSELGTIKPQLMNVPNPEFMRGHCDPMIYNPFSYMPSPKQESLRAESPFRLSQAYA
ncbi:hypothetical protein F5Y17DRAFT_290015 [Xylariaceae sp. FL0594]|nr:hypothetical protein F5Y17DRAFT_290015 [Xylariaceae sp. FL0594]